MEKVRCIGYYTELTAFSLKKSRQPKVSKIFFIPQNNFVSSYFPNTYKMKRIFVPTVKHFFINILVLILSSLFKLTFKFKDRKKN